MRIPATGAQTADSNIVRGHRPTIEGARRVSALAASLVVAFWIVTVDNRAFWRTFWAGQGDQNAQTVALTVGLALVLVACFASLFRLVAGTRVGGLLLGALLIVSGAVSHYLDSWGVLFDKNMIRNIVESDVREARELLSWPALADLGIRGLLPAGLLWFVGVRTSRPLQSVVHSALLLATAALLAGALLATSYGSLAATFRNHRELRFQLVPTNYLNAVLGHLKGVLRGSPGQSAPASLAQVAPDARRAGSGGEKPLVLVLIVGETARAANFSLGGYARETNQALGSANVVYFSNVASCGTDTATSLPCMFSDLGAEDFGVAKARSRENVLDVLQRTGVKVEWLDNNSGCKEVCARVPTQQMPTSGVKDGSKDLCSDGACLDEILVTALKDRLPGVKGDSTFVLHQMGSHGPSYYRRYPAPGRFQPTCDTNRIQTCDGSTLVNTYDNSIDYTSQVIARVIDAVGAHAQQMDVAVVYLSDHGESLGERNIYLHGLPLLLAPSEQTRVPMLAWLSEGVQDRLKLPLACLTSISEQPWSHDNLFPSLLGFFGVTTAAYRSELDVWVAARAAGKCQKTT